MAWAFRYQQLLDEGRYASISEMAAAERIERGYLGTLLRLTLLAPNLIEALLDGRQPEGVTLPRLLEPFPLNWSEQQQVLNRGNYPLPLRRGRADRVGAAAAVAREDVAHLVQAALD
jgi:hypothetical protein